MGDEGNENVIMVTHVEGPTIFWGQSIDAAEIEVTGELTALINQLLEQQQTPAERPLHAEKIYAARFSDDSLWYRCKIHKFLDNDKVEMQFIDYGNREVKLASELVELPAELSITAIPARADRLRLSNISLNPEKQFGQGQQFLKNLIENHMCRVVKEGGSQPDMVFVKLYIIDDGKDEDVIQKILEHGYALPRAPGILGDKPEPRSGRGQRPIRDNLQHGGSVRSPQQRPENTQGMSRPESQQAGFVGPHHLAGGDGMHFGGGRPGLNKQWSDSSSEASFSSKQGRGGGGDRGNRRGQRGGPRGGRGGFHDGRNNQGFSGNMHPGNNPGFSNFQPNPLSFGGPPPLLRDRESSMDGPERQPNEKQLREDIRRLQIALEKKEHDLKVANGKLNAMADYSNKCQRLEQSLMETVEVQHQMLLNPRIQNLVTGVSRVKKLRDLVPSTKKEDPCDMAFELLTNSNRVTLDMPPVTKVKEAHREYQETQEKIRLCTDKSEREDLTASRDQLRRDLYESITALSHDIEAMPLDSRLEVLHDSLKTLKTTYKNEVDLSVQSTFTLTEALTFYSNWKIKKLSEYTDLREKTDVAMKELHQCLNMVIQLTEVEDVDEAVPTGLDFDLEDKLTSFNKAVSLECKNTDVVKADGLYLGTTVGFLIKVLTDELDAVEKLRQFQQQMNQLKVTMAAWLFSKPDLSGVNSARAAVKQQKSRLRHALADYHDLEDQASPNNDELEAKKLEIKSIRDDLQGALQKEDEALVELLDVVEIHFPEVLLEHGELTPEILTSRGLLKIGRSLEHYDITAQHSRKVMKTTFCGHTVAIKELIMSGDFSNDRDMIIKNAQPYWKSQCLYLVQIQAIFWSGSHSYLQMPWYQENMIELLKKTRNLSSNVMQQITRDTLEALDFLHKQNIIHGRVHPANIFWHQGRAILAEFDITKDKKSRAMAPYQATNTLLFCAPELIPSSSLHSPSSANDIYCLGLVVMWLIEPIHPPTTTIKGVPQFDKLKTYDKVKEFLSCVLHYEPNKRPTAHQLLNKHHLWEADLSPDQEISQDNSAAEKTELIEAEVVTNCDNVEGAETSGPVNSEEIQLDLD